MKKLFILFTLLTVGVSAFPISYKVLVVSQNVRIGSRSLKPLELLRKKDVVMIPQGEYLAIIDELSNVYEYFGESLVRLDTLSGSSQSKTGTPDLENIYSAVYLPEKPVWNDVRDSIYFLSPMPYSLHIAVNPDRALCLSWFLAQRITRTISFDFRITDEFGDLVHNETTTNKNFCIRREKLGKINTVIFQVFEANRETVGSPKRMATFSRSRANDASLNDNSPAANLIKAIFLEENGYFEDALHYYTRCVELSLNATYYARILELFKARAGF